MNEPSFPGEHICEVCAQFVSQHSGNWCGDPVCEEERSGHVPPLCCPGCPCLSYEEAHMEVRQLRAGLYDLYVSKTFVGTIKRRPGRELWSYAHIDTRHPYHARTLKDSVQQLLMIHSRLARSA